MTSPRATRRAILGGLGLAVAGARPGRAEGYPDRPIRLVVPFAPGGAIDIVGRLAARYLTDDLGQQVYVDNRSGGGGSIGTNFVAKAPADGYTLLMHSVSSAILNGLLYSHLPYDPHNGFVAISELAASPTLVVINAKLPAANLQEFVALVRQSPGKFKFGSTGVGTSIHLDSELFATRQSLHMVHVPYRGEGDAIKDLVAGETQMEIGVASAFLPFIRSGQLRALCVNDSKRMRLLPDVPTAAEAGLADFELPNWYALVGPRGLPDAVVQRLSQAITKVLALPEMRQKLEDLGLNIVGSSPAEVARYWDQQFVFWEPVVKQSGIKLDN